METNDGCGSLTSTTCRTVKTRADSPHCSRLSCHRKNPVIQVTVFSSVSYDSFVCIQMETLFCDFKTLLLRLYLENSFQCARKEPGNRLWETLRYYFCNELKEHVKPLPIVYRVQIFIKVNKTTPYNLQKYPHFSRLSGS